MRDRFGPCEEVGGLVVVEAAAFFLIEKDDGVSGEVFALSCGDGDGCVFGSKGGGRGAVAFGAGNFGVGFSVGKDEEAEVISEEDVALAEPRIVMRAGGIGEPVSGEGEVAAESGECGVSGVLVAVKADEVLRG